MDFQLQKTAENSRARAGIISTDHGKIETPIFMPVGTAGSVKGIVITSYSIHYTKLYEVLNNPPNSQVY